MTTTALPSGFYVIKVVGGGEPKYLTCERGNATILTPNGEPGPDQEVMRRFLESSIVYCSPAMLVANHPR